MPFKTQLAITDVDGRGLLWRLTADLVYHGHDTQFTIPEGFVTDFASIPRLFWRVLPRWDVHMRAAVLHDWLYSLQSVGVMESRGHVAISRKDADGLFRRAMRELGVGWFRRWAMWLAVRLCGWYAFRKEKKK